MVQWLIPIVWYAFALKWHEVATAGLQCLVIGLLVRHQLLLLHSGKLSGDVNRLWLGTLMVLCIASSFWGYVQPRTDQDRLPYLQNVQPSMFQLSNGKPTDLALPSLWPEDQ